jgi:hypothetical protein
MFFSGTLPAVEQTPDEFLDMIVGIQGRRMDDQRAHLESLPGLQQNAQLLARLDKAASSSSADNNAPMNRRPDGVSSAGGGTRPVNSVSQSNDDSPMGDGPENDFLEMLIRCQVVYEKICVFESIFSIYRVLVSKNSEACWHRRRNLRRPYLKTIYFSWCLICKLAGMLLIGSELPFTCFLYFQIRRSTRTFVFIEIDAAQF